MTLPLPSLIPSYGADPHVRKHHVLSTVPRAADRSEGRILPVLNSGFILDAPTGNRLSGLANLSRDALCVYLTPESPYVSDPDWHWVT